MTTPSVCAWLSIMNERRTADELKAASTNLRHKDQVGAAAEPWADNTTRNMPFARVQTTATEAPPLLIGPSNIVAVPVVHDDDDMVRLRRQVDEMQQIIDRQERERMDREQQANEREQQQNATRERRSKCKKTGVYCITALLLIGAATALGVFCGTGNCRHRPTPLFRPVESTQDLYDAVRDYVLAEDSTKTAVAKAYGHPMGTWNVSRITNFNEESSALYEPLVGALSSFTEDLNGWDVGQATDMEDMFSATRAFNGNISNWNVGRVTNMKSMFQSADAFNRDISDWNVGRVTDMRSMFRSADAFNGDISNWNVGKVTEMRQMFGNANVFCRNLCPWRSRLPWDCDVVDMFSTAPGCPGAATPELPDGDSMCQLC